jgi:hypothetical protein
MWHHGRQKKDTHLKPFKKIKFGMFSSIWKKQNFEIFNDADLHKGLKKGPYLRFLFLSKFGTTAF